MRYLLISLAAFLLLALPAFATTPDTADLPVTVTILQMGTFDIDIAGFNGDVDINNKDQYGDKVLGYIYYDVETNDAWTLQGRWVDDTNWPTTWYMNYKYDEGSYTPFTPDTWTDLDWADYGSFTDRYFWFEITGIVWPDGPIATGGTINLWLGNDS